MFSEYLPVLVSVISLLINASVQVVVFRYFPKSGLLKSEYLGFGAGLGSLFIISFKEFTAISTVNLIMYFSFSYCYFNFVNLGETARRVRILRELYDSAQGLSLQELLLRYNGKEIIERRIDRLLHTGQIVFRNGRYYIGIPLMLLISRMIMAMKLVILGKRNKS